jgi:N-acetyl-gamma-glutamyl-phosphate reductase
VTGPVPATVIGASGYVGGEFLRLISQHPGLALAAAVSDRLAGEPIAAQFPHLAPLVTEQVFVSQAEATGALPAAGDVAVFSAAPHGGAAAAIAGVLADASSTGCNVHVADASADFRFRDGYRYAEIYGQPHGAPELLDQFHCAVPEHSAAESPRLAAQPGCFATAMLLAIVPLTAGRFTDNCYFASGITGSTGSGKTPVPTTHSPERHSNLFAYKPLAHRHAPEVVALTEQATGTAPALHFVPHSGPFARGIHMTVHARLAEPRDADGLRAALADYYVSSPFVRVVDGTPRLKNVVASNFAHIGVATDGDAVSVFVVIDNLLKGAAGGAMQWMNRSLGFEEQAGLTAVAPAWT